MKKTALLLSMLVATFGVYGQGYMQFNNLVPGNFPVTIGANGAAGEGAVGAYVGSDYSAVLLFQNGDQTVGYSESAFLAGATTVATSVTPFFGATGGGPTSDGAGLFDYSTVNPTPLFVNASGTTITAVIAVYYNVGHVNYADALAGGANVGFSNPFLVALQASSTSPQLQNPGDVGLQPFTVGTSVVPEPSTFALAGLGLAGLLIFRRRK